MDTSGFRPEGYPAPVRAIIPKSGDKFRAIVTKYGPHILAVLSLIVIGFAVLWPGKEKESKKDDKKERESTVNASAPVHIHNYLGKEPKPEKEEKKETPPKEEKKEAPPKEENKEEKPPPKEDDKE